MPLGPASPVRAITTYRSDDPAPEMNCLTPGEDVLVTLTLGTGG